MFPCIAHAVWWYLACIFNFKNSKCILIGTASTCTQSAWEYVWEEVNGFSQQKPLTTRIKIASSFINEEKKEKTFNIQDRTSNHKVCSVVIGECNKYVCSFASFSARCVQTDVPVPADWGMIPLKCCHCNHVKIDNFEPHITCYKIIVFYTLYFCIPEKTISSQIRI